MSGGPYGASKRARGLTNGACTPAATTDVSSRDRSASIGRAVVDDDQFEIGEILPGDVLHRLVKETFRVQENRDNRNPGRCV